MNASSKARLESVRTVGIPVTDQDRALEFYTEVLGFEKLLDTPLPQLGGRWIEVGLPRSATTVALVPAGDGHPAGVDTGIRFTTEDATALHTDLAGQDVAVDELLAWPGVPPMFDFRDPDGNTLYVSEVRSAQA
ncbi:VOC family protein [Microlunatus parietis]|uniref:Catechol 2,3-dioxygenase-like lactoylglutathione lyase family enzyme n=1 Tax=Microlunatus parietis TaxID=682979 RepID=A0A7Y9I6N7_9ACTN|nr:VOC family protein [Microlunatus parietis]NYE71276.1 catechol 2,3-dioxygenase-like lactoylglutathione lyase family enzyme [Microlunatus parietis]